MATLWTDVVLTRTASRGNTSTRGGSQRGFALVATGRFGEYRRGIREGQPWPSLDSAERSDDPDRELLAAFLQQVVHGRLEDAVSRYLRLSAGQHQPDLKAVAGILGSLALADDDRHDDALALLRDMATDLEPGATLAGSDAEPAVASGRALVALHRGWRLAEHEDWHAALEATEPALLTRGRGPAAAVIRHVAESNLGHYRQRLDPRTVWESRRRIPRLLQRHLDLSRAALEWRADQDMGRELGAQSAAARGGPADTAERDLWVCALYDELLGWAARVPSSRSLLGRHRLLRSARRADRASDHSPPGAEDFRLLLEGQDAGGLERAARWYHDRGPLDSLATLTMRIASRPWLRAHEPAMLALWRVAGGLLGAADADLVLERLGELADDDASDPRRSFDLGYEAMQAFPAVLEAASGAAHRQAVGRLLGLVAEPRGELLVRGAAGALGALRWADATEEQRATARGLADHHLEHAAVDPVASALLLALAPSERGWAARTITEALRDGDHGAMLDALALDTDVDLPPQALDDLVDRAARRVARRRREAAEGRWGVGRIDDVFLLAVALLRRSDSQNWETLFGYLADPATAARDKVAVLDLLAYRMANLPGSVVEAAAATARRGIEGMSVWPEHGEGLPAAAFRFELATGSVPEDDARERLLGLVAGDKVDDRIASAWSLPLAWNLLRAEAPTLTAVLLRDRDHRVRAAAGAMLARLPQGADGLREWVPDAWRRLLDDAGVLVPLTVLRAIAQAGVEPAGHLRARISDLEAAARSAHVRHAARDALGPAVR